MEKKDFPFSISLRGPCRSFSRAGRGGGRGDNANYLETDPAFIDELGSVSTLFDMVTTIGNGYEGCRDSSQNASHAPPEINILKDLRKMLLAANTDIPSRHVETSKQR